MGAQTCVLPTYHASNQHRVQENIDSIVTWPSAIGRDCRTAAGNNVLHAEAAPRASWQSAPPKPAGDFEDEEGGNHDIKRFDLRIFEVQSIPPNSLFRTPSAISQRKGKMISQVQSRLAMVSVLLALQVKAYGLELIVFLPEFKVKNWYTQFRQWTMPAGVAVSSAILSPLAFAGLGGVPGTSSDQQSTGGGVDGDVAGDGVRIGIWVQISVLVVISLLGIFQHGATGDKEVGAGLVLTHVSVTIAEAAQVAGGVVLSLADAATGAMILDAQIAALSIQLTANETLAARWQVSRVVATQALGLAVIPVLVARLADGSLIGGACPCVEVFWWAWLG